MPPKPAKKPATRQVNKSLSQAIPQEELDESQSILNDTTSAIGESQTKIDEVFKPVDSDMNTGTNMSTWMTSLEKKLDKMASKDFIESQLSKIITKEVLSKALDSVKDDIKKEIKEEIAIVNNKCRSMENALAKVREETVTLQNRISNLEDDCEQLTDVKKQLTEDNNSLQSELKEVKYALHVSENNINDLEQYSRRNSVRIYGVHDATKRETATETTEKVIKMVRNELGISLLNKDIDIAHRLGKFRDDGNRVIICKFVSRMSKMHVLKERRKLKGKPMVIREDLTTKNAKLLESISRTDEVKSAWTEDGRVIALLNDDKMVTITPRTDLSKPLTSSR